jgi:hypothetical protein
MLQIVCPIHGSCDGIFVCQGKGFMCQKCLDQKLGEIKMYELEEIDNGPRDIQPSIDPFE